MCYSKASATNKTPIVRCSSREVCRAKNVLMGTSLEIQENVRRRNSPIALRYSIGSAWLVTLGIS